MKPPAAVDVKNLVDVVRLPEEQFVGVLVVGSGRNDDGVDFGYAGYNHDDFGRSCWNGSTISQNHRAMANV
jgi:hypothetical protein